jgi:hypothetical protein
MAQNELKTIDGRRLGKLPARQSRKALMFSDFVKYSRVPATMSYWKGKKPVPARTPNRHTRPSAWNGWNNASRSTSPTTK